SRQPAEQMAGAEVQLLRRRPAERVIWQSIAPHSRCPSAVSRPIPDAGDARTDLDFPAGDTRRKRLGIADLDPPRSALAGAGAARLGDERSRPRAAALQMAGCLSQ